MYFAAALVLKTCWVPHFAATALSGMHYHLPDLGKTDRSQTPSRFGLRHVTKELAHGTKQSMMATVARWVGEGTADEIEVTGASN